MQNQIRKIKTILKEAQIEEFEAELVGITVFAEGNFKGKRVIDEYNSLLFVKDVNTQDKTISVVPGNYFKEYEEKLN